MLEKELELANYLRYLIKLWEGESPIQGFKTEEVQNLLDKIEKQHPELKEELLKLKINFWFKAAQFHFHKKIFADTIASLVTY